ncbi:MAG: aldo/keto reductase, partial [Treponema sp.]|nr:aldo/keto reductase [Treponema sp.]
MKTQDSGAERIILGRTGLSAGRDGFGALPLQRTAMKDAVRILNKALEGGINFFDTARAYTDSELKIGRALSKRRGEFILASKTMAVDAEGFWKDLETSLTLLKTDHIDIYQFHNPPVCVKPGDGSGLYEAAFKAREQGKIRFIGFTNHRVPLASQAVESGLYDTLQFPFSYLSGKAEFDLMELCGKKNIGFIAMKALSGGLITGISTARAWFGSLGAAESPGSGGESGGALPIWGIQREDELDELLAARASQSGGLSAEDRARIAADRVELAGEFCRGCGYCLPCPAGIALNFCARMPQLIRRMPTELYTTEHWIDAMARIPGCTQCGSCVS